MNFKDVSAGTWARLALLIAALANTVLAKFGINPLSSLGEWSDTAGIIITVAAGLISYWKNNSFTLAAQKADEVMEELKRIPEKR